jgi:DNA-directed RNA polymerase specialized sigma24 family protein
MVRTVRSERNLEAANERSRLVPPTKMKSQPAPAPIDRGDPSLDPRLDLGATRELLPLARGGDSDAKGRLFVRYERPLSRFLHARMPAGAHTLVETQDVVQEVFARALESLSELEFRGAGAFWAYLRTVGMRYVFDLQRRSHVRRAEALSLSDSHGAPATGEASPLAHLIGSEQLEIYERALGKMQERTRQALLLRI